MSEKLIISNFLNEIFDDWQGSLNAFPKNKIQCNHWPIPFFGNPATALIATVGINPSSAEFSTARCWPKVAKGSRGAWKLRIKTYFNRTPDADDWFDSWTIGLALLDCGYQAGTAAHIDVSYRPTTAMLTNERTDRKEFREMAERDVKWFFKLLPLCPNLRVLLTMGPIVGKDGKTNTGLFNFLMEHAPRNGFKVKQTGKSWGLQSEATGTYLIVHEADTRGEKCITCRVVKNLHKHRDDLRKYL